MRWIIAVAGSVIMLVTGTLYSWAIFTEPLLVAFHWDLTTTTWAYAIANFSLAAIGAIVGGFWQDEVGPRKVAMTGVALWGTGNLLAGIGTDTFGAVWLYATYGVIGGIGAGMAYVTPLAAVTKWFPQRRGLAGGLVVGCFGLGAFIYNQWVPQLPGFHAAVTHAGQAIAKTAGAQFTAGDSNAVMQVFVVSGLVYLLIGLPAAALLRDPPPGEGRSRSRQGAGYSPVQVLGMPQFYLLWLQLFVNVLAGITIISNAVYILTDLTRLTPAGIAPLFGMVSIFNAIGRFFWGGISDRIGCNRTFAAMFALQAVTLFWLSHVHGLGAALAGVAVVLLCCGGGFGTMPAYNARYFGTRYVGRNYGMVLSAWGFAGLIGPILTARLKDLSGSFGDMMELIAVVLAAAMILPFITHQPSELPVEGSRSCLPDKQ
jgi:OFA family oxalate/formate antiporter-like MFS transporter